MTSALYEDAVTDLLAIDCRGVCDVECFEDRLQRRAGTPPEVLLACGNAVGTSVRGPAGDGRGSEGMALLP